MPAGSSGSGTRPGEGTGAGGSGGGGGFSGGGGTGGGQIGGGGNSGGSGGSNGSSGGSGGSGDSSGNGGSGGGNQYQGPSEAELEAMRQAQQTARRRQKDQQIAEQAQREQRAKAQARQNAKQPAEDSSIISTPQEAQQSEQQVAPKIETGNGMYGAGNVDLDTGEVVTYDIPGRQSYYEAPTTSNGQRPSAVRSSQPSRQPSTASAPQASTPSANAPRGKAGGNIRGAIRDALNRSANEERGDALNSLFEPSTPNDAGSTQAPPGNQAARQAPSPDEEESGGDYDQRRPGYIGRRGVEHRRPDRAKNDHELIYGYYQNRRNDPEITEQFPNRQKRARETETFSEYQKGQDFTEDVSVFRENREANYRAADETADMYATAYLPVENMEIGDDLYRHYPEEVETAINSVRRFYGDISEDDAIRLVILRLGLGVDKNMQIFKESLADYTVPGSAVIQACNHIIMSQQINGHPLGLVDGPPIVMEGSFRYPIGVVPKQLAISLAKGEKSPLYGKSPDDITKMVGKDFANKVLPRIRANTRGDKINQRYALENMVRAISSLDGMKPEQFGVSNDISRRAAEIYQQQELEKNANPDLQDVYEHKEKRLKEAERRAHAMMGRKPIKDEDGQITGYKKPSSVDNFFNAWASWMKFAGVAGNVPIIASGAMEHAIGNFDSWCADLVMGIGNKDYRITTAIKNAAETEEAKEALAAAQLLYHAGGMEMIEYYTSDRSRRLTKDDVNKFILDLKRDPNAAAGGMRGGLAKVNQWIKNFTDALIPFDIMFRTADTKAFFRKIMINQSDAAKAGRPALTSTQVEEALKFGTTETFVRDILSTEGGRDALVGTKNMTLDRVNPLTAWMDRTLKKHGVTNWAITTAFETYLSYGVNLVQLLTPFSNTISYIAVRGVHPLSNSTSSSDRPALDYQLGGHDAWLTGFKKNFVYDAMKLGNYALITILGYTVIQLLGGIDDPDDELAKFCWDEYKIGGQTIRLGWMLNDIVGFAWPAAVAMAVQEKHPDDPDRVHGVFLDGCLDMVNGSSLFDMVKLITECRENVSAIQETIDNPDAEKPINWQSETTKAFAFFLSSLMGKSTPNIFKQYRDTMLPWVGPEARDRSAYYLYDQNRPLTKPDDMSDEEWAALPEDQKYRTVYNTDELDVYNRSLAKGNPLYGMFLDMMHFGLGGPNTEAGETGYCFWEMPISTMKDPRRMKWFDKLEIDFSQGSQYDEAFMDSQAEWLVNFLENELPYSSVEEALADGFIIPYEARKNATDYCYKRILLNKLDFVQKSEAGEYPDYVSSYAASTRMQAENDYWYNLIDKWFKNDDIPWSDVGYERLLSDYQVYYVWKDTGQPVNLATDGWQVLTGNSAIEKRYEPYGNHPTSLLPFTVVDRENRGFNAETIPNWYREGLTNTQNVFDTSVGETIATGRDKGQDLADVLFGGQPSGGYAIDPATGVPTIGHRAYVAADGALPADIADRSLQDVADALGVDLGDLDDRYDAITSGKNKSSNGGGYPYGSSKRNYNTWKRYYNGGGGGGGSSYNPKIYSNPKSVNADRAASMYTKVPYGTTTTYLRPGFYTKGSREAYKRSDM